MFSENQKEIAAFLYQNPRKIKEICDKLDLTEDEAKKELRLLVKIGAVVQEKDKFKLITRIEEDLAEKQKAWKEAYRAILILDWHSNTKKAVEDTIKRVIEEFQNNPNVKVIKSKTEDIIQTEGKFSGLLELEIAAKTFVDLADIVSRYGISSVEILYPKSVEMNLEEAQGLLLHVANVVFGYENMLRHLQLENKGLREQIEAKVDKKI